MDIKEWEKRQAAAQGKTVEEIQAQGAAFRDFDEFFGEVTAPPLVIHFRGEDHELPGDMPAVLMLRAYRAMADAEAKGLDSMAQAMSEADVLDMAHAIFGKERLDAWSTDPKHPLLIGQLERMVEWCAEQYQKRIAERNGLDPMTGVPVKKPNRADRRRRP
jgi:hypothetical protein